MTLQQYLAKSRFRDIWKVLRDDFGHQEGPEGLQQQFETLYVTLVAHEPALPRGRDKGEIFYIFVSKLMEDEPPEAYSWDFAAYELKSDTLWSLADTPWEKWLGLEVCEQSVKDFGLEPVMAVILEEMLVWGCGFSDSPQDPAPGGFAGELAQAVDRMEDHQEAEEAGVPVAPLMTLDQLIEAEGLDRQELADGFAYMDKADLVNEEILHRYRQACRQQQTALEDRWR